MSSRAEPAQFAIDAEPTQFAKQLTTGKWFEYTPATQQRRAVELRQSANEPRHARQPI